MFYLLFGNYLVERSAISETDYLAVKHKVQETNVKLGLLAMSEGLMTLTQANEVNRLQACMDKRFGDIATEKGYLNKEQVDHLLSLQETSYSKFIQLLVNKNLLTLDQIAIYLKDYQSLKGYTDSQMATLKSEDNEAVIPILLQLESQMHSELISLTIRNLIRFIDPEIYVTNSYIANDYVFENLAIQAATGDHNIQLGFSGNQESLLQIATIFADEEFTEIDADSYDAICEFINCINGLYATKLSEEDINIDMLPPYFYANQKMKCNNLVVVTVNFSDYTFDLILSIDSPIEYLQ
ncbi:MAG: chemotaxis protein CheX [bacterium]|nr:chemotaxis protein CheX [bacterium]